MEFEVTTAPCYFCSEIRMQQNVAVVCYYESVTVDSEL